MIQTKQNPNYSSIASFSLKETMYKFSLETVLNHRKQRQEALQKEFAILQKELFIERERLERLEEIRRRNLEELQRKQRGGTSVSGVMLYDNYIKQISKNLEKQTDKVAEVEGNIHHKRGELIEAMKRRKTLDRLKEKEWEAYRKEFERKEQIFMGEIAVSGFNRRK